MPIPIRVFLVEDYPLTRSGIRTELAKSKDIEVIGEAATGRDAISKAQKLKPDVILMDISLSDVTGFEVTSVLQKKLPDTKIVALTMHDDENYVREMIRVGGSGYVLKDSPPDELLNAIITVHNKGMYYSTKIRDIALSDYAKLIKTSKKSFSKESLTPRRKGNLGSSCEWREQ